MRRFAAAVLLVCAAASLASALDDPLESLIDSEKERQQAWLNESHEVPAVFLWGDEAGVSLDDPRAIGNPTPLCSEIEYDKWAELGEPNLAGTVVKLNVAQPRLREMLEETCLMRPTDHVLAVGAGWQKNISLESFVLRHGPAPCLNQFPYSLWGAPAEELPSPPLFYTTHLDFGEQDNHFAPVVWTPLKTGNSDWRGLAAAVPRLDDYAVSISSIGAVNVDALYFLERRTVTPEDNDLPHQLAAWCKGGQCQTLWLERVSDKKGSGHIRIIGTLDFNNDGRRDLVLDGDNAGCPYKKIFMGLETGFSAVETPQLACSC